MFAMKNIKHIIQFMTIFKTNFIVVQKQQIKYKNTHTKSKNMKLIFILYFMTKKFEFVATRSANENCLNDSK